MHEGFDVKSQSWTHASDVFIVQLFQYGSLSSIVKAAARVLVCTLDDSCRGRLTETKTSSPSPLAGSFV